MPSSIELDAKISEISMGMQYLIVILRALYSNPRILILDEPRTLLLSAEVNILFKVVKILRNKGISVIIIPHKIEEVQEMVNRCTVIKNGRATDVFDVEHMSQGELALRMIGHPFDFASVKLKMCTW